MSIANEGVDGYEHVSPVGVDGSTVTCAWRCQGLRLGAALMARTRSPGLVDTRTLAALEDRSIGGRWERGARPPGGVGALAVRAVPLALGTCRASRDWVFRSRSAPKWRWPRGAEGLAVPMAFTARAGVGGRGLLRWCFAALQALEEAQILLFGVGRLGSRGRKALGDSGRAGRWRWEKRAVRVLNETQHARKGLNARAHWSAFDALAGHGVFSLSRTAR